MPGPLKRPLVRRLVALAIACALAVDMAIFAVVGYGHLTRTHARVRLVGEHEIVQIFVDCKLAYFHRSEGLINRTIDLGFLKKESVITFQIRGQKHSGYIQVSYFHDGIPISMFRKGTSDHLILLGPGRVAVAGSWTVEGRKLGTEGCQADAPQPLAFASPGAGTWKGDKVVPFGVAASLGKIIPWVLAVLGAMVVAVGAIIDRMASHALSFGVVARGVLALAGIAVAVVWALATQNFSFAFGLCVATGVMSLLAAFVWLLADDIRGLACSWMHLPRAR